MFSWIKRLFGGERPNPAQFSPEEMAQEQAFNEGKQVALDEALGGMEDYVVHAGIPFYFGSALGGTLALYSFRRHIPGILYVTQELFSAGKGIRPMPSRLGYFELAVAYRDDENQALGTVPPSAERASRILNPAARYASMAALNPGETAEIPSGDAQPNTCFVLDRLDLPGKSLAVLGEPFFILLVIHIHPSELAFARKESSAKLLERLKARGYYPYSDLDRDPVV